MTGKLWLMFQADPRLVLGGVPTLPDEAPDLPPDLGEELPVFEAGKRLFRINAAETDEVSRHLQRARGWLQAHQDIPPRAAACQGETFPGSALDELLGVAHPGELWIDAIIHHDLRTHLTFGACQDTPIGPAYRLGEAPDHLPPIPLVGREAAIQELMGFWRSTARGASTWVHLSGPAGIGKTRLMNHVLDTIGPLARVIRTRCHLDSQSRPLELVTQIVRALSDDPIHDLEGRREEGQALASMLGLIPPPSGLAPSHRRFMGFRALHRWLRDSHRQAPRILVIEDTHWIDTESRDWFQAWLQDMDAGEENLPILVLSSARTPMRDLCPGRFRFAHLERALTPLDHEQLRPWLSDTLPHLPPAMQESLLERSGGNPLHLQELVRLARLRGEDLTRGESIPDEVRWDLESRLDLLPPAARPLLEAASMVGMRFERDLVNALMIEPIASEIWDTLVNRGLLERLPGLPVRFAFAHPLFLEIVRDRLEPERRRVWHTRIATELWTSQGEMERVAEHLVLGNPTAYGMDILLTAARDAIGRSSWRTGRTFLLAALAQSIEGTPSSLWLDLVELGLWLGEWEESGRILDTLPIPVESDEWLRRGILLSRHLEGRGRLREAHEFLAGMQSDPRATDPTRQARLVLQRARVALRLGDWDQVESLTGAIRSARPALTTEEQGHRASLLGNLAYHRGQLDQALELHREALRHRTAVLDLGGCAGSWINLGTCTFELGDWDESQRCFAQARELAERTGEVWLRSLVLNNEGHLALNRGHLVEAERAYREAFALKQRLHEPAGEAIALANLALVAWRRGHLAEAEGCVDEAVSLLERSEHLEVLPEVLAVEARLHQDGGDETRAQLVSRRILELTVGTPARGARGSALRILADQARRAGLLEEAERLARECLLATEDRPRSLERGRALATWGRVALQRAHREEGSRALAEARACFERLQASLDMLDMMKPPPDWIL